MAFNSQIFKAPSLTSKPKLGKTTVSSSVFGGASSNVSVKKISFGGLAKAIGSQPDIAKIDKISAPEANPLADIVSDLQSKFEGLQSTFAEHRNNFAEHRKNFAEYKNITNKGLAETNKILQDIGSALALDFANRIAEEKSEIKGIKEAESKKAIAAEEKGLEAGSKKISGIFSKTFQKVTAPVKGLFDRIREFFTTILTGMAVSFISGWLSKDENRKKLTDTFKWLTDNWKLIAGIGIALVVGKVVLSVIGAVSALATLSKALATLGIALWPIAKIIGAVAALGIGTFWLADFLEGKFRGGKGFQRAKRENSKLLKGAGVFDKVAKEKTDINPDGTVNVRKYIPNPYGPGEIADFDKTTGQPIYEKVDISSNHPDITPEMRKNYEVWKKENDRLDNLKKSMDEKLDKIGKRKGYDFLNLLPKDMTEEDKKKYEEIERKYNLQALEFTDLDPKELGFKDGGEIGGKGGPKSDNIIAKVSPGEYVIQNPYSKLFKPLLNDINKGGKLWKNFDIATGKSIESYKQQIHQTNEFGKITDDFDQYIKKEVLRKRQEKIDAEAEKYRNRDSSGEFTGTRGADLSSNPELKTITKSAKINSVPKKDTTLKKDTKSSINILPFDLPTIYSSSKNVEGMVKEKQSGGNPPDISPIDISNTWLPYTASVYEIYANDIEEE